LGLALQGTKEKRTGGCYQSKPLRVKVKLQLQRHGNPKFHAPLGRCHRRDIDAAHRAEVLDKPPAEVRRTGDTEAPRDIGGFGDPYACTRNDLDATNRFNQLERRLVEGEVVE